MGKILLVSFLAQDFQVSFFSSIKIQTKRRIFKRETVGCYSLNSTHFHQSFLIGLDFNVNICSWKYDINCISMLLEMKQWVRSNCLPSRWLHFFFSYCCCCSYSWYCYFSSLVNFCIPFFPHLGFKKNSETLWHLQTY